VATVRGRLSPFSEACPVATDDAAAGSMAAVLLLAAPTLQAPDDPGSRGLWAVIALVLVIGLVAAHVRVLRAIARQVRVVESAVEHPQVVAHEPDAGQAR
jgi:hypothetical protein